jgi:multisubunit Na+/H+ antiporter MnhF subunit
MRFVFWFRVIGGALTAALCVLLIVWTVLTRPSEYAVVALLLLILAPIGAIALKRMISRRL